MSDKDFREIDKETNKLLDDMFIREAKGNLFDMPFRLAGQIIMPLNQMELDKKLPPNNELIPIGEYDGSKLPLNCYVLDNSYTVYIEVDNPELT